MTLGEDFPHHLHPFGICFKLHPNGLNGLQILGESPCKLPINDDHHIVALSPVIQTFRDNQISDIEASGLHA
jgi:hypothetical protein